MIQHRIKLKSNQRREAIITSAIDLMARKSIGSTSMSDIANSDGISKTLLYRYFKNKYQILCAIVDTRLKIIIQIMEELFDTIKVMIPDLKETLPLIWKLLKKRIEDNQKLIVLFFRERVNIPHYLQKMVESCDLPEGENYITRVLKTLRSLPIEENLTEYFQKCKDAGTLSENLTASECTKLFLSLIWTPVNLIPLNETNETLSSDLELETLVTIQIKVLLHGLLPRK